MICKWKKKYLVITSEDNDTDSVYIKPGVSSSKPFEELLKSKEVKSLFTKANDRSVLIRSYFESNYKENKGS